MKKIKPNTARSSFHIFIGGLLGAPLSVMLVSCISSLIGSFKGIYFGFIDSIKPFEIGPFLFKSIQNIAEGSSNQIVIHLKYLKLGAQFGPFIFAVLGFWLSFYNWESDDNSESNKTIENSTENP